MGALYRGIISCLFVCAPAYGDGEKLSSVLFDEAPGLVFKVGLSSTLEGELKGHGTGFAVSEEGLVATAFHVVHDVIEKDRNHENGSQIFLIRKGVRLKAEIWAIDPVNDLAIIKVPVHFAHVWPIARALQKNGDELHLLGYPGPGDFSVVTGRLQSSGMSQVTPKYQITAAVTGGMSGGPVLNGASEVVGAVLAVYAGGGHISLSSQSAPLIELLRRAKKIGEAPSEEQLRESMHDGFLQLQEQEATLLKGLFQGRSSFHGWILPGSAQGGTDMDCSEGNGDIFLSLKKEVSSRFCTFKMATNEDDVEFSVQFSAFPKLSNQFKMAALSSMLLNHNRVWSGSRRKFGKFTCEPDKRVVIKGALFDVSACSRLSNESRDIFHTVIRISSLDFSRPAIVGRLSLVGFTKINSAAIGALFVNSLELDNDYEGDDET